MLGPVPSPAKMHSTSSPFSVEERVSKLSERYGAPSSRIVRNSVCKRCSRLLCVCLKRSLCSSHSSSSEQ